MTSVCRNCYFFINTVYVGRACSSMYICIYVWRVCHSYPFFALIQFVCQLTYYFCCAAEVVERVRGSQRSASGSEHSLHADTFRQTACFRIENVFVRTSVVRHMFDVNEYQSTHAVWYVTSKKNSKLANQKRDIFCIILVFSSECSRIFTVPVKRFHSCFFAA